MSQKITFRSHQFLAGRFHEGYGRTEISRADEQGRRKQTIDYDAINLDGRNSFFYDGYRAYEIEPTHADWKCPGVFCITNGIENGSQAARTYGLIPETGDIEDALRILREKPELSFSEFSDFDNGKKELTWHEGAWQSLPRKEYVFEGESEKRLRQFLTVYWNIMSGRMMEPENHDVVALHLSLRLPEEMKGEEFQELVDFFSQQVVFHFPAAVQAMTSVAFGVPWAQRRMHPAAACIVTTSEKDLNANPVYSFDISYSGGK